MTISSTNRKAGPFIGNGSASTFPFSFKVFQASDVIAVSVNDDSGVEVPLTLNGDYTCTLNPNQDANPGGSITLTAGPLPLGINLVISSSLADLQGTELTNQGGFYPEVITNALDLLTILVQQLQEQVNRSLKYPITDDPSISSEIPSANIRAGQALYFDSEGAPTVGQISIGYGEVISSNGQAVFPTPPYYPGQNELIVVRGGSVLTNGIDYTETSKASITVTTGDVAGGEVFVFRVIR